MPNPGLNSEILSSDARLAVLYALGHGANLTEACRYADVTLSALLEELNNGLDVETEPVERRFALIFGAAFQECLGNPQGPRRAIDFGPETRFEHADYLHQLRQRVWPDALVSHDAHYLDY